MLYLFVVFNIYVSGVVISACEHAEQKMVKRENFSVEHLVISSVYHKESLPLRFKIK